MQPTLLFTANMEAAKKEIENLQGKISQEFTEELFTAELPPSVKLNHSTANIPGKLSRTSQLAFNAWKLFKEKKTRTANFKRTGPVLAWDAEGHLPPGNRSYLKPGPGTGTAPAFCSPTSRHMTESIAVGLIIVSGPGNLAFSEAEKAKVISEVQEGLNFLASEEPRAKISFVYDIREIAVNANPGPQHSEESAEAPWRNEALTQMGFEPRQVGSAEYVTKLKAEKRTRWAYVAWFTKYELHYFAYTTNERIVMNYFNNTWGVDSINQVFAHETCHIFGAADEIKCLCTTRHGELGELNGHCRDCTNTFEICLMANNDLRLCPFTRKQIGWDVLLFPR